MEYEVEIKFRVADHQALGRLLVELGAEEGPTQDQEDAYLAHPGRDFAQTGEALRLRRNGAQNWVTYKGPKLGGPAKTREEIEVPFAEGGEALARLTRLYERLGFRVVAVVRKQRRPFHLTFQGRGLEVALDRADGLGSFVEVEALADGPDDLDAARAAVVALGARLGLEEVEPRSYLRMVLEQAGGG